MKAQTYLEAYNQAQSDKQLAVATRKKHHWGIAVDEDYWALLYQKRQRQGEKFLTALTIKLTQNPYRNLLREIRDYMSDNPSLTEADFINEIDELLGA